MFQQKRGTNYTIQEKEELMRIVSKFKIVENKQTDGASMKEKNTAWAAIAAEFNSLGYSVRNAKHLKNAYENIKQKTKKNIADGKVSNRILYYLLLVSCDILCCRFKLIYKNVQR